MFRRSWQPFLAGLSLIYGMTLGNDVLSGELNTAGSDARFQQIFANSGDELTYQLPSMRGVDESYGAPTGYCENTCCAPGEYVPGCGEYCGEYCGAEQETAITFGGWTQFGYTNNVTPLSVAPNDDLSFNDHPDRFSLYQGWLYAEKEADGSRGLDWGFRVDVMYGVDGPQTQAFGNPPGTWDFGGDFTRGAGYGWAVPQVFAELENGDWNVKAGHFYTLVGYEVVTSPDNFFFSHSLTMFNSEPFTHTGVVATYQADEDTTLYGGWTSGWDTGFNRLNNGSSFLGGFSQDLGDDVTFTYITTAGELGWRGNGYSHSLVLDLVLTDNLNWVIQSDLVRTNDHDANPGTKGGNDDIGLNQYLIYSVSDKIGLGGRMEWWKNEGKSQWEMTYGVNIRPTDHIIIRPEIRYDWQLPGADRSQTVFGMDAILTF